MKLERMFAEDVTNKGLISKIYKQFIQFSYTKQVTYLKRRPKQTFLQRRHTDGQQAHEKIKTAMRSKIKTT